MAVSLLPRPRNPPKPIHYAGTVPSLTVRIAAGLAAACAVLISSCAGSHSGQSHPNNDDKPVITGEPAAYNNADVTFANNLTAREEQGLKITGMATDHSDNSDLVAFATKTAAAFQVDTQVLKALRAQWKEGGSNPTGDGAVGPATGPAIDDATITKLQSLHGAEFDSLWLGSMISLDQGAIEIANTEVANGKHPDAVSLAKQIVTARQAEIGQLHQMSS